MRDSPATAEIVPGAGKTGHDGQPGLLDRWWFVVLLALAAAIPLAIPAVQPLTDLSGHVGRYAVQLDGGASPVLRQWYTFEWGLLPNLGVDLLVQVLAPLIGLELAVRIIVAAIAALHVAGVILLARVAHGRTPPTVLFAVPLVYSFPLLYGFVNFALGIALAWLALALWLKLRREGRTRLRASAFVVLGFILWTCHLVGWAVFCAVAFADAVAQEHQRGKPWWQTPIRAGLALLPLLVGPAIGFAFAAAGQPDVLLRYDKFAQKPMWLMMAFRDRWLLWDMGSAALLMILAVWFWRSRRFERHRGLALGALLMFGIYVVMPNMLLDSQFADMRLVPVVLTLFLIAARPAPDCSRRFVLWLTIAGLAFTGARLGSNAASMVALDGQFRRTLSVLPLVPEGTNLLTFPVLRCGEAPWPLDRRNHLSGYALARRGAFDNIQYEMPSGQLLRIHNEAAEPFDRAGLRAIFDRPCGTYKGLGEILQEVPSGIEYVWIIGMPPRARYPGWSEVGSAGDSSVLRRTPGDGSLRQTTEPRNQPQG
jgi:hypothetical protein